MIFNDMIEYHISFSYHFKKIEVSYFLHIIYNQPKFQTYKKDTNWHQKEQSRALKLQIYVAEIWNWARNEKWYKNDIKSSEGQNFDIISKLYHPLKNYIKISLSLKKWYNDMIVYHFQCLGYSILGIDNSRIAILNPYSTIIPELDRRKLFK
jgi:hypothetical protein